MRLLRYLFSTKARAAYSRLMVDKFYEVELQMNNIYGYQSNYAQESNLDIVKQEQPCRTPPVSKYCVA